MTATSQYLNRPLRSFTHAYSDRLRKQHQITKRLIPNPPKLKLVKRFNPPIEPLGS